MKQLLLSDREVTALNKALELYIRLGLGQIDALGPVLEELHEKRDVSVNSFILPDVIQCEGKLEDKETSSLTLAAFGIQAKLGDNTTAWEWVCKQLHDRNDLE